MDFPDVVLTRVGVIVVIDIDQLRWTTTIVEGVQTKAILELNINSIVCLLKKVSICHRIESDEKNQLNHANWENLVLACGR